MNYMGCLFYSSLFFFIPHYSLAKTILSKSTGKKRENQKNLLLLQGFNPKAKNSLIINAIFLVKVGLLRS